MHPQITRPSPDQVFSRSDEKRRLLALLLGEEGIGGALAPIQPRADRTAAPLSFAQQRIWILNQLEPGSHYTEHLCLRLEGSLDSAVLERSFNEILARHECMRARFVSCDGNIVQKIDDVRVSIPVVDLATVPVSMRGVEAVRRAREEAHRAFDLAHSPLWRALLIRLACDEHILVVTMHHIASDGWSCGVFARELAQLYEAFAAGLPSPLPHPPIQYADYAAWQRQHLQGEVLARQLAYWKKKLSGAPPTLNLPADRPRPKAPTFQGARHVFAIDAGVSARVKEIAQRENSTPFMVLLAAFKALLHRYTAQSDIVVGTPMTNRSRVEVEGLIGFFVNSLVLRSSVDGEHGFRQLLRDVRATALEAYAHPDVPFERLVEELQPERSTSHNPLFQVFFILQAPAPAPSKHGGVTFRPMEIDGGTSKLDLTLNLAECDGVFSGWFEYASDLFDAGTIARMAMHFQILLRAMLQSPDEKIATLPLLSDTERTTLLFDFNHTHNDYPREACVHQLFEAQAAAVPDRIALQFGTERLTYAELNARANQLARHLGELGAVPGSLIGICLERSPEMVVGLLATMKSGAAYVPLDPHFPQERLAHMIADARPLLVLTQQSLLKRLPEHGARTVCIDRDCRGFADNSNLNIELRSTNLAYVLYTSGSTAKPKGVQISHRSFVNFLTSMQRRPGIASGDTLLAVTTLSFDIAGLEIFLPLVSGARVAIADSEAVSDPALLIQRIEQSGATILQATPATFRMLVDAGWSGSPGLKVLCGGEMLTPELAARIQSRCGALWNMYGPTETTIWSSALLVEDAKTASVIGGPIANTQLYVLDSRLQPVPIGVRGELFIGGDGVAEGYLNLPRLTSERFIRDPFRSGPGARMYRTGDFARYRPDGTLEFLGRTDQQVKIRGFRIELGEVESALTACAAVRECAVVAREDASGVHRLLAYVTLHPGAACTADDLSAHLKRLLPEYMVPSGFAVLDALPLTPNGKIDRRALPPIDTGAAMLSNEYVEPRTPLEDVIRHLFREVLQVERVGVHDNFFSLGGHSLLATQLIGRTREALQLAELPARVIFEAPTVAQLAAAVPALTGDARRIERIAELLLLAADLPEQQVDNLLNSPGEQP